MLVEGLQANYYYYYYPALCSSAFCECLGKNDRTHTHTRTPTYIHTHPPIQALIYILDSPINIYETLTYNVSKPPRRHLIYIYIYIIQYIIYVYKILVKTYRSPNVINDVPRNSLGPDVVNKSACARFISQCDLLPFVPRVSYT